MTNHPNRSKVTIPATHEVRYWTDKSNVASFEVIFRGNEQQASRRFYNLCEEISSKEDCELVELFTEST